jgi:hypothetical protein
MTVLFIRANRISPIRKDKQGGSRAPPPSLRNRARAPARDRALFVFDHEHEHEMKTSSLQREIFVMRACMSAAVIDYASLRLPPLEKNENRVGR